MAFKNTEINDHLSFAVGTDTTTNKVEIVTLLETGFEKVHEIPLLYPATKIQWAPRAFPMTRDFVATSTEKIQIWNLTGDKVELAIELALPYICT